MAAPFLGFFLLVCFLFLVFFLKIPNLIWLFHPALLQRPTAADTDSLHDIQFACSGVLS